MKRPDRRSGRVDVSAVMCHEFTNLTLYCPYCGKQLVFNPSGQNDVANCCFTDYWIDVPKVYLQIAAASTES